MSDFGGAAKPLSEHPDYKIAILGVPFDEKSSYLRGSAQGPAAVRAVSTGKCYCGWTELGVNLEEDTVLVDLGDVDTSGDMDKSFALIEKGVAWPRARRRSSSAATTPSPIPSSRPSPRRSSRSTSCISTPIPTSTRTFTATASRTPAPSPASSRTVSRRASSRSACGPLPPRTGPRPSSTGCA
jgi:hypothetical protein